MEINIIRSIPNCDAALSGKFTFTDYIKFKELLEVAENPAIHCITVDFAQMDFIDSAGLGMLMILHNNAAKNKQQVLLKGVKGQVEKVLRLAHMDSIFKIVFSKQ